DSAAQAAPSSKPQPGTAPAAPGVIVHKFGGTSVADAERYRHVAGLLMGRDETVQVTVVSAMKGVTDDLIELARAAAHPPAAEAAKSEAEPAWRERWHALRARHRAAAAALLGEGAGATVEWL